MNKLLRYYMRAFAVLFSMALVVSGALAHEQKIALTDILYNERTGNLEIAHRIRIHDAEHALHKAINSSEDLALSPKAQAEFAKYVAERFELSKEDESVLSLTLVGQELERGYLWVYQETKIPEGKERGFYIANTILQDAVKGQVNTVNIRYRKQVATFVFESGTGRKHYAGQ